MTSVSAGHIVLTPTQPVGSGRPQRESNPGPPQKESRALPTELPPPPFPQRRDREGEKIQKREEERGGERWSERERKRGRERDKEGKGERSEREREYREGDPTPY